MIDDETVMAIRRDRADGKKLAELVDKYDLTKGTISRIVNGRIYTHLPVLNKEPVKMGARRAVSDEQLDEIRRRWVNGDSISLLAIEYGVDDSTISSYVSGMQLEKVNATQGARYRDALMQIANGDVDAKALAREVLGLD